MLSAKCTLSESYIHGSVQRQLQIIMKKGVALPSGDSPFNWKPFVLCIVAAAAAVILAPLFLGFFDMPSITEDCLISLIQFWRMISTPDH